MECAMKSSTRFGRNGSWEAGRKHSGKGSQSSSIKSTLSKGSSEGNVSFDGLKTELLTCAYHLGRACKGEAVAQRLEADSRIAGLTARQREILGMVVAGHPSKRIAASLGISQRTVENHRASIMKRTGARSLPSLTRMALFATGHGNNGTNDDRIV